MRLLPVSSGICSEGLTSFTFKVVQETLNTLKMEAANSFETLVPIYIYIYIYKYTRYHIAEDNKFRQTANRGTKYWINGAHKITRLPRFDIPDSKRSDNRIFIINTRPSNFAPFLHDACSCNILKDKCVISYCNGGTTVSVYAPSAVTPPCASLVRSVSAELAQSVLSTGSSAQRISQLCFCVCYHGVSKWRQLTMPAGSRGSLGCERA